MSDDEQIVYRLATHADYQDVLDIASGIYAGSDYLGHMYHIILHSKNCFCGVAVCGDKLVSFSISRVST